MARNQGEKRHLLVNSDVADDLVRNDEADTTFYQDSEQQRKLKASDVINITMLCLDIICHGMGYALIASYYPITAQTKGLSIADVGIVMSTLPMACLFFGMFFGYFLPKIGTRRMLLGSLLVEAASLLPFAFVMDAPAGAPFYVCSVLCRTGQGIAFVASQVAAFSIAAGDYNDRMSTVMGLLEMSVGFGLSLGPAVGGVIYDAYGFKVPFYCLCAVSIFFFVVTYIWVHPTYSFTETDNTNNEQQQGTVLNMRTVWKVPAIFIPFAVCICIFTNFTFFDVAMAPFLHSTFDLSSSLIGLIFLCTAGIYAFLSPVVGHIIDKKGHNGLTMVLGCFLAAPAFMMMGPSPFLHLGHNLWISIVAIATGFISFAMMYVPIMGLCFQIALDNNIEDNERTRGFISSVFVTTGNFGNLLGPFMGGILINNIGFGYAAFTLGMISLTMGLITAVYLLYANKKKELQQAVAILNPETAAENGQCGQT